MTTSGGGGLAGSANGNYSYGDSAHFHAVTAVENNGTPTYSAAYDAAGDMTCRALNSSSCNNPTPSGQSLTYDALRRLVAWQNGSSSSEQYAYDGEGHRVWRQTASGGTTTTTVSIFGVEDVTAVSGGASTTTRYYALPGGVTATRDSSGLVYEATDALGTPIAALNLFSGITGEQLRAPYGQARYAASVTGSGGGMRTPFGFTGQREDTTPSGSSGLDYFNARSYDTATGRFTSADDAQPGLGDPSGQDNYAYVGGMVENATDPSGHAYAPDELGEQAEQGGKIGTKAGGDDGDGNDGSRAGDRPPTISSSTAAYVTLIILGFVAGMVIGALLVEHQDQAAGVINQQTAHAVAIANAVTPPSDDVPPINRKTKIPSPPPPPPTGSGTPTTGTTTETPTQTGGGGSGQLPPIVTASGCGCEWLYRGLGSQDDPSAGLYPRNPGNRVDVFKHVREASRAAYPGDQFISLTKSEVVASVKYGRLGVVRIDPSMVVGNLIDLSTSSGRLAAGIPPDAPAWNWARADAEVLLDGYIPPEAITPFTGDLWSSQEEC